MPKVTVIVPNYNHARFLRQRIDTILVQTFQDFELILLDDASTDDSRSILSSYSNDPHVSAIEFNEKNSGSTYKQWNKGVRLARGEYVWIAESDDYSDPHFLERLVPLLECDQNTVLTWCRSRCITEDGRLDGFAEKRFWAQDQNCWGSDYRKDGREICRNYMIRNNIVLNASSALFRKAAYERNGGADESMRLNGDWKLWASLMLQGQVAYIAEPLNYYRFHDAAVRYSLDFTQTIIPEWFAVVRWIEEQVTPPEDVLRKAYRERAEHWVPALLSLRVSWDTKREILRGVRAMDPHPLRRSLPPALHMLRLKFLRHWRELTPLRRSQSVAPAEGKQASQILTKEGRS